MALATWWKGDTIPALAPLAGFEAGVTFDTGLIAQTTGLPVSEIYARLQAGNRPYIAWLDGTPAAYGWVATRSSSIGELDIEFELTPDDRYLWDFATLPEWRGRGIYPRLLQTIIRQEAQTATRLWIIYAPENAASASGIPKAGFRPIADLSFLTWDCPAATAWGYPERAVTGAALLGVPLIQAPDIFLAPRWQWAQSMKAYVSEHPLLNS